jgi:hypothetical protein
LRGYFDKNLPAVSYARHADTLCEGLFNESAAAPGERVAMKIVKSEFAEPVLQYQGGHKVTGDTTGIFGETSEKFQKNEQSQISTNPRKVIYSLQLEIGIIINFLLDS